MALWCAAVARAQVANGDFATGDLTAWIPGGVAGDAAVVEEGTAFSVGPYSDTTDVVFPSGPWAARLVTAPAEGSIAILQQTFEVTHTRLLLSHREESKWLQVALALTPTSGPGASDLPLAPSVGAFRAEDVDVSALCGGSVRLEVAIAPVPDGAGVLSSFYLLLDDVALGGDLCPDYVDSDGDGWCGGGVDDDGDGLCDADAEVASFERDCDETDPSRNPGADEVAGDGVDQDCDGLDLCYVDVDGDGYAGSATAPGDDLVCGDAKGEAAAPNDCDDADPGVFPGGRERPGDGIDGDCDGGEICWSDADGDGLGVRAEIASDDADCDDPGESLTTDDCDDADPTPCGGVPDDPPAEGGGGAAEGGCGCDSPRAAPGPVGLLALLALRRRVRRG